MARSKKLYPDQFVKLKVLDSYIKGDKKYFNEVAVICSITDNKKATKELVTAKDDEIVYHTRNEEIVVELRGFKGLCVRIIYNKRYKYQRSGKLPFFIFLNRG